MRVDLSCDACSWLLVVVSKNVGLRVFPNLILEIIEVQCKFYMLQNAWNRMTCGLWGGLPDVSRTHFFWNLLCLSVRVCSSCWNALEGHFFICNGILLLGCKISVCGRLQLLCTDGGRNVMLSLDNWESNPISQLHSVYHNLYFSLNKSAILWSCQGVYYLKTLFPSMVKWIYAERIYAKPYA